MDDFGAALADPKTYADRKRYHALLTTLRHEDPLHRATPEGFRPFWVATKHADITEIGRQPDVFLSGPRLELFSIDQEERVKASTGRDAAVGRTMLHMDGREHRSYRGITQSWFLPTNMRRLEQQMEDFAREYVDKLAAVGGEADFVPVVSELFPLNVILLILGLPPSEAPHLLQLTRDFVARENVPIPEGSTRGDQIVKVAQAFFDYFAPVFEERRKHPQNDVASVIALGQHEGKPIDRLEALSYYLLLGLAGHDTTNGTLSGGLLAFIEHPDQLAKLKANPDLMNSAVDEVLRWVTPVNNFMRTAARDYQLRGKTIKAGDAILLPFGSANRDEDLFDTPFTFDVARKPNPHIAFGYGAHACLGQHLAKMELRALFKELFNRLQHVELSGQPVMIPAVTGNHLKTLPIRYQLS